MKSKGNAQNKTAACHSLSGTALVEPASAPFIPQKSTRNGAIMFSLVLAVVVFAAVLAVAYFGLGIFNIAVVVAALIVAVAASQAIHIAMEWERIVICRFGAFKRVAGPGLVFMIPVIEQSACRVDLRTVPTPFGAEKTLTSDLVPVDIDAVLFWMVFDAEKACVEVEDYCAAVLYVAQTAMRDAIGRMSVAEVALSREQLDKELQEVIERECEAWGIAVLSVKVRDIVIPAELQEVMSMEAQAEREKNARLVLAGAEQEIADMIAASSEAYENNESALKVRTMHLLYESIKKSGGTVVTVPTALSDGFSGPAQGVPTPKDV